MEQPDLHARVALDGDNTRQAIIRRIGSAGQAESFASCAIAAQLRRIVDLLEELRDIAREGTHDANR